MLKGILKRTTLVGLVLVLVLGGTLIGGCAKKEALAPAPTPAPSATPAHEPAPKQELVVGIGKDNIVTEGPWTSLAEVDPNANVYETLVYLTPDFQVEPLLATRWEYVGENTWRFYLRQGIKFHDGQEFTAEAVKFTLDKAVRPSATSLLDLDENSVRVVDKYTVDITPAKPNRRIVELLTHPIYGIKALGSERGKHPVGTGPFRFVSYEKDKQLTVERNPDYWGEKAKIDTLIFRFIPDPVTRVMALQSGEVDVITYVPEEMVAQIKETKGLKVLISPTAGGHSQLRFRVNGPKADYVVKDKALRLAVAYALDRGAIIEAAWYGFGKVSQCELPPEILGEFESLVDGFTYDPDRAKELLDQAGWEVGSGGIREKNGRKLILTLVSGYYWGGTVPRRVPQIIQAQLKDVGIAVEIVDMIDYGLLGAKLKEGFGHLWLGQADQNNADPTMWPSFICHSERWYSSAYDKVWAPGEEFDRVIEDALKTPNPEEAQRLTSEALHILVDQEAVMVPLALTYTIFGAKEGAEGLMPHPSFNSTLWDKAFVR